jgi:hypothetical protein
MLFGETVAVYCENRTERTGTLCGQNVEFVLTPLFLFKEESSLTTSSLPLGRSGV